jgi:predicted thioesterase
VRPEGRRPDFYDDLRPLFTSPERASMTEPALDSAAAAELVVTDGDLASAWPLAAAAAFPAVFATARMTALMEIASARRHRPCLSPGQFSVGVSIDATHSAATPPGATVTATARFLGRDGKLFCFEVVARDAGGDIGRATHKRAVVDAARAGGQCLSTGWCGIGGSDPAVGGPAHSTGMPS